MSAECFPVSVLPHTSRLYLDYVQQEDTPSSASLRGWYGASPLGNAWMSVQPPHAPNAAALADALAVQAQAFQAGPAARANIDRLRAGARAVITGQQVGLFGGPLLTLLKAATAIARAAEATRVTGIDHVPVFWLATEDHDLPEVDQATFLNKTQPETLRSGLRRPTHEPVGQIVLGPEIEPLLEEVASLLDFAPEADLLRELYAPGQTLGIAFARLLTRLFAAHGLVVLDASSPAFHRLGASTLRFAIQHAADLEADLLARSHQLEAAGYHAQVRVADDMSLLFLVSTVDGAPDRQALRRSPDGTWRAGRQTLTTDALLAICDEAPERISPNALLRPVFQDTLFPTAAYIGGPAEIAYFAQSAVLYSRILGRITPVLPRLSATLVEPAIATVLDRHELQLPEAFTTAEALALRLGARAMPIEGKRRLAAAGNQLDRELEALTAYLSSVDQSLGRSATVSASKMRYQMNRLRRMAARFELEKETSLQRHADVLTTHLFPGGHPQERVVAGIQFVGRHGDSLIDRLVTEAANPCPGHLLIRL